MNVPLRELHLFSRNKRTGEPAPDVAQEELLKEKQVGGPVNCSDSELCTFLRGLGEGYLPTFYSDTSQSVQSKSMSIASRSYQRGKKIIVFHGFQFLQMSRSSTEPLGPGRSISSPEAFPARTFPAQAAGQELRGNDLGCGLNLPGSFVRFDPSSSSWKTAQCSLLEDLNGFSETWPRWGSMRNGVCWARTTPAHLTSENESGFWPTPTVNGNYNKKGLSPQSGDGLATAVLKAFPTPCARDYRSPNKLPFSERGGAGKGSNS